MNLFVMFSSSIIRVHWCGALHEMQGSFAFISVLMVTTTSQNIDEYRNETSIEIIVFYNSMAVTVIYRTFYISHAYSMECK